MTDVAHAVCLVLQSQHISVTAVVDNGGTIHVAGCQNLPTEQEVVVLRAFCACSAHVVCDPAVTR